MTATPFRILWQILAVAGIPLLGVVDWQTGYELNFFVFYFLPISVGAWFGGLTYSIILSVLSAFTWYGAETLSHHTYSDPLFAVWNTLIRLISFLAIGWAVASMRSALMREQQASAALRQAISQVKVLEGILPICCGCKKIREKDGTWRRLETYIGQHANTTFSHGYCPECEKQALRDAGLSG